MLSRTGVKAVAGVVFIVSAETACTASASGVVCWMVPGYGSPPDPGAAQPVQDTGCPWGMEGA